MTRYLVLACVLTGTLLANDDAFAGKWRLDPSKSVLTDQMKVQAAGPGKYAFIFSGTDAETIVADGTDQPGLFGSTLAVTVEGPRTWKVVRKAKGRTIISAVWNLSEDGNTLTDAFTGYRPDGSAYKLDYVYKRIAGASGFAGTWESTSEKVDSVFELEIRPWEEDGLSFIDGSEASARNMKFDGKDYPNQGANDVPGSVSSGRRLDERTLEISYKTKGRIVNTQRITVSPDLRTLTMTIQSVGRDKPNILVFDRE